ncbi:MAG: hypothetical protein LBQ58_02580 [Synergistaceae bacterium]|jgi:hypothetical protein|nr:hypothetical protein [Synergistaceae bacterium]
MTRGLCLLCISLSLLAASTPAALHAAEEDMDFLWLNMTGQSRTRDGGMVASFDLHVPSGARADDVEVVYRAMSRAGTGAERSYGAPEAFRKRPEKSGSGTMSVTVYSGRTETIELMASARIGDTRHYASTVFSCFGESGNADPDAERMDSMPDWPAFKIDAGRYYFRAQTGIPIELSLDSGPSAIGIFEARAPAPDVMRNQSGGYIYTPPHDEELADAGYTAKKDVVFTAMMPDGVNISFYLPVYRAFYGQTDLRGGLGVLSGSAAVCLALVAQAGRRFKWR